MPLVTAYIIIILLNSLFSVFDNVPIPYPKRKFLWDDENKDDKEKVCLIPY